MISLSALDRLMKTVVNTQIKQMCKYFLPVIGNLYVISLTKMGEKF